MMDDSPTRQDRRRFAMIFRDFHNTGRSGSSVGLYLMGVVVTLLMFGMLMVFSASFPRAGTYFFLRQILWIGLGAIVFVVMMRIPYHFWQRMAVPIMLLTLGSLLAVLVIGQVEFGARRFFFYGSFQPNEIAKLALIIYLSAWAATRGKKLTLLEDGLFPFALVMSLVAGLVAAEGSFSVTIVVVVIGLAIYAVGGGRLKHIGLILMIAVPILLLAMQQAGYPFARIIGWYNLWFNPSEAPEDLLKLTWMLREGYWSITDPNTWAIKASVPGLWNDFLFASISSDLGFMGVLGTVALFAAFGFLGLQVAEHAPDRFGALLAVGITTWILIQATLHICANTGLIPTLGIPLPFLSYGGSSMMVSMAGAGLLLNVSRTWETASLTDPMLQRSPEGSAAARDDITREGFQAQITPQEVDKLLGPRIELPAYMKEFAIRLGKPSLDSYTSWSLDKTIPFGDSGRITDPGQFFDRNDLMQRIFEELAQGTNLWLTGAAQVGKSSVLAMICALGPAQLHLPAADFAYLSVEWVENENDFFVALADILGLKETLRGYALRAALKGRRIVLCLDDVDKMDVKGLGVNVHSQLRGLTNGQDAPIRLVLASRAPLSRPFADLAEGNSSLAGVCRWLPVEPFTLEIARAFLQQRLVGSELTFTEAEVTELMNASGGIPGKLQSVAADMYRTRVQTRSPQTKRKAT